MLLWALAVAVPVACAVHVIKTGRPYWWLWIIFIAPGLGAAVYFLAEVLPELRRDPTARRMGTGIIALVDPGRSLRQLEDELEACDTVKNRQALARGYVAARRYGEAIEQYQRCLSGIFKDDPCILLELAHAQFLHGQYAECGELLGRLETVSPSHRPLDRRLLMARTLEELGDPERALAEYAAIVRQSSGEETRCRYALLLSKMGKQEQAEEVFQEIVKRSRRSPRYYRRAQKEWIAVAKQNLPK
jgi:hypothetical protein